MRRAVQRGTAGKVGGSAVQGGPGKAAQRGRYVRKDLKEGRGGAHSFLGEKSSRQGRQQVQRPWGWRLVGWAGWREAMGAG